MLSTVFIKSSELTQPQTLQALLAQVPQEQPWVVMPYVNEEQAKTTAAILASRAGERGVLVCVEDDARLGFIRVVNETFAISTCEYFTYLAQDAFPGRYWLALALKSMKHSGKGLLAFNDGKWFGKLAAFGMVRRQWAVTNYGGELFYSDYNSHYADTELTLLAMENEQLDYNPNAVLVEIDYEKDRKPTSASDKALFAKRKINGFDGRVLQAKMLNLFV
jgi:hypothetical protein